MVSTSRMRRVCRRLWLASAGALGVAALLASGTPASAEPTKIRVGYDAIPLHVMPVIFRMPEFLQHLGKEYTVEFFRFRGSPLQVQALAANEVDIAAVAYSTFATAITTAKLPIKGISDLAQDGPWFSQLYAVKDDSGITRIQDLKGKVMAVNAFGGAADMGARAILVKNGLTPDRDVRIIEANFGAMGAMIRQGKVATATFLAPTWAVQEKQGGLRVLFRLSDGLGTQQLLFYAAKQDFIAKNRKALVAFYEDYLRGLKAMLDPKNRPKVLEMVAKLAESPVENFAEWALLEGKDYYHSPDGKINVQALQSNINALKDLGLIKQSLDVTPHIDHSLLDEAAKRL